MAASVNAIIKFQNSKRLASYFMVLVMHPDELFQKSLHFSKFSCFGNFAEFYKKLSWWSEILARFSNWLNLISIIEVSSNYIPNFFRLLLLLSSSSLLLLLLLSLLLLLLLLHAYFATALCNIHTSIWVNQYVICLCKYFFDCCEVENDSDALIFNVNETGHWHSLNVSQFSSSSMKYWKII